MMATMMHLQMMVIALAVACCIRLLSVYTPSLFFNRKGQTSQQIFQKTSQKTSQKTFRSSSTDWQHRWAKTLSAFLVPPLFLVMTALAIVIMGPSSCHAWEGWLSYQLSIAFLCIAGLLWAYLGWISVVSQRAIRRSPTKIIQTSFGDIVSHILDIPLVFSAQVGCWNPALAISHGLIETLNEAQLSAVIAHETGHLHYKDTFWFLWLGGLRRLTFWLPGTDVLWQELLLLRELRADRWATQYVDKFVLAESLMQVVAGSASQTAKSPTTLPTTAAAHFSCPTSADRLSQRIDAILATEDSPEHVNSYIQRNQWISSWISMGWALTPLLTIPLHH